MMLRGTCDIVTYSTISKSYFHFTSTTSSPFTTTATNIVPSKHFRRRKEARKELAKADGGAWGSGLPQVRHGGQSQLVANHNPHDAGRRVRTHPSLVEDVQVFSRASWTCKFHMAAKSTVVAVTGSCSKTSGILLKRARSRRKGAFCKVETQTPNSKP